MYTTSSEYKQQIKKYSRTLDYKITCGTVVLTGSSIIDIQISTDQPSVLIGNTIAKKLELTFLNSNILYNSNVKVEIGILLESGSYEYINMGTFHIDSTEKGKKTTKIVAYDSMLKTGRAYFSSYNGSTTISNLMAEICTKCGIEFQGTLPTYSIVYENDKTCREMIGYIASLCGGNAYISRDKLVIVGLNGDKSTSIDKNNFYDFKIKDLYKVGKITCNLGKKENEEESEISCGTISADSMELQFSNPYMTQSILNNIYGNLKDFSYYGYECSWSGDLALDMYDFMNITDTDNTVYTVPVLSYELNLTGGLKETCKATAESKSSNSVDTTGSVTKKIDRVATELALVNELMAGKITVDDLIASNIDFNTASGTALKLQDLLTQFISGEMGQLLHLTSSNVTIDDAVIKNIIAAAIKVSDLKAGSIDTNTFNIVSQDGGMSIIGPTQQFKDSNGKVRLQIGQDAQGNFNFILIGADGTTTLIDQGGIKEGAIGDKLIKGNMVADNTIKKNNVDIDSLITGINEDGTQTIKSTKVVIDETGQTFEAAFNEVISTIQSGNRNLIPAAKTMVNTTKELSGKYWSSRYIDNPQLLTILEPSTEYTFSYDYELLEKTTLPTAFSKMFGFWLYSATIQAARVVLYDSKELKVGDKGHLVFKFKTPEEIPQDYYLYMYSQRYTTNGNDPWGANRIKFSNIMLVKGAIERDYEPAPDDLESKVETNTTQIGVQQGQITQLIANTTITEGGETKQLKDKYNQTVADLEGVKTSVSSAETTLKKGGKNYIIKSEGVLIDNLAGGANKEYTALNVGQSYTDILDGTEITISFDLEMTVNTANPKLTICNSNRLGPKVFDSRTIDFTAAAGTKIKGRYSVTSVMRNRNNATLTENYIEFYSTYGTSNWFKISNLKLEIGKIATPWTPYLANIESRLNNTESKITDSAIVNVVSSAVGTDNKALFATTAAMNQTAEQVRFDFKQSGGYNLVKNSGFKNQLERWTVDRKGFDVSIKSLSDTNQYVPNGKRVLLFETSKATNFGTTLPTVTSSPFGVIPGNKYSFSFKLAGAAPKVKVRVYYTNSSGTQSNIINEDIAITKKGGKSADGWATIQRVFTAYANMNDVKIEFSYPTTTAAYQDIFIMDVAVTLGTELLPWSPAPDEVYSGNTVIDGDGVTIFNGAFKLYDMYNNLIMSVAPHGTMTFNGSFGTFGNGGKTAMTLEGNNLYLYDWTTVGDTTAVGSLKGFTRNGAQGIGLLNYGGHFVEIGYCDIATGNIYPYVEFDNDNKLGYNMGIIFRKYISMLTNSVCWGNNFGTAIWGDDNKLAIDFPNTTSGGIVIESSDGNYMPIAIDRTLGSPIRLNDKTYIGNDTYIATALYVEGSKHAVQDTSNYGKRAVDCYEMTETWWGDLGSGTVNSDGECVVYIDDMFSELIDTNKVYHVFTQVYNGAVTSIDRHNGYFIVKGEPGTEFSWEMKAKRKGFADDRLVTPGDKLETDNFTMDGDLTSQYKKAEEESEGISSDIEIVPDTELEGMLDSDNEAGLEDLI